MYELLRILNDPKFHISSEKSNKTRIINSLRIQEENYLAQDLASGQNAEIRQAEQLYPPACNKMHQIF